MNKLSRLALNDFTGTWIIERRIDDFLLGRVGQLDGTATFASAPNGLAYCERGTLIMEDQKPMSAERRYLWSYQDGRIIVAHADGASFHSFAPSGGRASACHTCGRDEYRVIYTFSRWPHWRADWRVQGPNKHYRMTTAYDRAP